MRNGLVRISAGMIGILLNSCSPRESSNDLHLSLGFVSIATRFAKKPCHPEKMAGQL